MCPFRRKIEKNDILEEAVATQRFYEERPDVWRQLVSDPTKTPEDFWHANEKLAERPIADENDRPWWKLW